MNKLDGKVKGIKAELNQTWFVRFASQKDCMTAAQWLLTNGKLAGQKIKFRVKSKLTVNHSYINSYHQSPNLQSQPYYDQNRKNIIHKFSPHSISSFFMSV